MGRHIFFHIALLILIGLYLYLANRMSSNQGISTLIHEEFPIFQFFNEIGKESPTGEKMMSGINAIGRSSSVEELLSLFPAPNTHVEFEDIKGKEEIRVIESFTGYYHYLDLQEAKVAIEKVKEESRRLFSNSEEIFPSFGYQHEDTFWSNIIIFDAESYRTLPVIKRVKDKIPTMEYFNSLKDRSHCEPVIHDEFAGIVFHRTGEIWLATEEVRDQAVKELDEFYANLAEENYERSINSE